MSRATEVVFRAVREGDIEALLAGMRAADLAEVVATTDTSIEQAVIESLSASSHARAVEINGEFACLLGVAPLSLLPAIGAPWMLGTDVLDQNPRALVRESRWYIQHLLGSYQQMLNFVDARNVRSIRWLRSLGFTIHPAQPYGVRGLPFHRFDMGF